MTPKVTSVSVNVAGNSTKSVQSQKTGSVNSVWAGNKKTVTGKIKDKNGNFVEKQFIVVQTGLKNGRSLVMDEKGNQYTMSHDGIILKQEYAENPEKFKADPKNKKAKHQYKVSKDKADNIAFLDNQLATAKKALKAQEEKDGWAGDVANAFGYINVFKKDKNTYSAVKEDLSVAESNNKKLKAAAKISDAEYERVFAEIYETPYNREAIEAYKKNPTEENWQKAFGKKQLDPSKRTNNHIESQQDGAGAVKTTAKVGIGIGATVMTGGNLAAGAAATALASELIDESDNLKVKDLAKGEVNFRNDNHGEIAKDAAIAGVAAYGVGKAIQLGAKAAQATGLDKAAADFAQQAIEKGKILLGQYGDDVATSASTTAQNAARTTAQAHTRVINGKVYKVKRNPSQDKNPAGIKIVRVKQSPKPATDNSSGIQIVNRPKTSPSAPKKRYVIGEKSPRPNQVSANTAGANGSTSAAGKITQNLQTEVANMPPAGEIPANIAKPQPIRIESFKPAKTYQAPELTVKPKAPTTAQKAPATEQPSPKVQKAPTAEQPSPKVQKAPKPKAPPEITQFSASVQKTQIPKEVIGEDGVTMYSRGAYDMVVAKNGNEHIFTPGAAYNVNGRTIGNLNGNKFVVQQGTAKVKDLYTIRSSASEVIKNGSVSVTKGDGSWSVGFITPDKFGRRLTFNGTEIEAGQTLHTLVETPTGTKTVEIIVFKDWKISANVSEYIF